MPRLGVNVTEDMDAALKELADERGATTSNLVRQIIAEYLGKNGKPVEAKVKWGGKRKRESQRTRRDAK